MSLDKTLVRLCALAIPLLAPGFAAAALTVTPLTWNVIGLDSNNPASGPKHFPVGARVCSTTATSNVVVDWAWDSANANINLRPGSLASLTFPSLAAGACVDAYFEVEVAQVPAAYDTARRYHISATDTSGTASTPTPRELYVEHLISQSRNAVTGVKVNGTPVPAGGGVGLVLGNTYTIELDGGTATQGYNQFESFVNFPNAIFQILSVSTTYSADNSPYVPNPNDRLYADACLWDSNPTSANYRTCVGGDYKAGGSNVVTVYTVKIIGGGGTSQPLSTLLYDFSGSSFHYNADFSVSGFIANIIDPTSLGIGKSFAPTPTVPGGTSTLTFTISNPNAGAVSGVSFSDALPLLSGGQMVVASPATYATAGCGTPVFAPVAGASSISFSGGTVAAGGSCTVSVQVRVPASPTTGTYVNTSGNLFVGTVDTGKNATASLGLGSAAGGTGVCGLTMAKWSFGTVAAPTLLPDSPLGAGVGSATLAAGQGLTAVTDTTQGSPAASSVRTYGWQNTGPIATGTSAYLEFAIDTSNYTGVELRFNARRANPGPTTSEIWYSTNGGANWTLKSTFNATTSWVAYGAYDFTGQASTTGTTLFRIYGFGANNPNSGSDLNVDDVTFSGCGTAQPPTIAKIFAPSAVAVGGTSTLTFTLTNPNIAGLTGVKFTDTLPAGVQVASPPAAATNCGGAPSWAPTAGATTLDFGQTTPATIPASGSCTVSVNVTATSTGPHVNVSGFVSSTESGTNTGAGGSATATLTGLVPPTIAKDFSPNPIPTNGTSILTLTIANPNVSNALTGIAFTDSYPAGLVNANPLVPAVTSTCGGTLTANAGGNATSLSGGTLAAGASCTIEVPVTSAAANTYANTTGPVSAATVGSGNSASASLTVKAPSPAISLAKKVGTSATGPWLSFLAVAPGTPLYYQFVAENVGDVTLDPFAVSDPVLAGTAADPATCVWQTANVPSTLPALPVASPTLDPTATCVVGPVSAVSGTVTNTATASGTYGGTAYPSAPEQATYLGAVPGFNLAKEIATSASGPWSASVTVAVGTGVYYRFTIVNTGGLVLTGINVTDPLVSTVSCTFTDPLPVGAATSCTVGPVTAGGAPGSTTTNTAVAHGTNGGTTYDTPPASASYSINPAVADLAIAKTNGAASVTAGGATSYTITVTNNGPDEVTGATVVDTAPAGMTFGAWTCAVTNAGAAGTVTTACGAAAGSGNLSTTVTMRSGAVITYTVNATIASGASGSIANTATVTPPTGTSDPTPGNDSATDTDTIVPLVIVADVSITKTDGVTSVIAGGTTTYTIVVSNAGPNGVTGASVSDPLPAGISGATWTCSGSGGGVCPASGSGGISASVDLPAGATVTFTLVATIAPTASGTLANTATVTVPAGVTDPTPGNNSATDNDTVTPAGPLADLAIAKTDGLATVLSGGTTSYTVTVTNNGPSSVTGAILVDPAAAGLVKTVVTCSPTPGQCGTPPTVAELEGGTFALPPLASGATYEIVVAATVTAVGGNVVNAVSVSAPPSVSDPTPGNNSASDTDAVASTPPPTPIADLAVTKTNGATSVTPGGSTVYTLTVTNNGPAEVTNASVVDTAAPGLTIGAWICAVTNPGAGGTVTTACGAASGSGSINATVTMKAGAVISFTVNATVTALAGASIVNTVSVAPPTGVIDPTPANNGATDTDPVVAAPVAADLSMTKTDGVTSVIAGGTTTYTIVVSNAGPNGVTGASVSDPLPAGISGATWTCLGSGGGTCPVSGSGGISASVDLPAGASVAFTLVAAISAGATGTLANTATVTAPAGVSDPTPGNNSATDTDTVVTAPSVADLAVGKTSRAGSVVAGGATTYTITITNNGPDAVTNATVTDVAPPGLTLGAWTCAVVNAGSGGTVTTACGVASGSGNISTTVTMKAGAVITYTVAATVAASASGTIVNVATVTPPAGVSDPVPANGSATSTVSVLGGSQAVEIPTLDAWMLVALTALLGVLSARFLRRANAPARRPEA